MRHIGSFLPKRFSVDGVVFDSSLGLTQASLFLFSILSDKCCAPLSMKSLFNPHGGISEALFLGPPVTASPPHLHPPPLHHQAESHRADLGTGLV